MWHMHGGRILCSSPDLRGISSEDMIWRWTCCITIQTLSHSIMLIYPFYHPYHCHLCIAASKAFQAGQEFIPACHMKKRNSSCKHRCCGKEERDYRDEHSKSALQSQMLLACAEWIIHTSALALPIVWMWLL